MNQATNPRARGALFSTGDGGGFRLSANEGSGQPTLFDTANEFSVFSAQRLFGVEGSSVFDITFRDPTNPTQVIRGRRAPMHNARAWQRRLNCHFGYASLRCC